MAIVETTTGAVEGRVSDGIFDFRGIPFAAPPVGDLRFRPPQPPQPWTGVRDATRFGPTAPQNLGAMERMFGAAPQAMDEDCLTLNIWTPGCDDAKRPVMVWIHGGAFLYGTGATPWYNGRSFARDDVVLVTINYRLGAFGFLHVDGQGNNGILDQVATLEWVRDNIAAFGGDPGNVTAFGESAGAMSVGTLLGMPAAKGLFVKAIPESGAAHTPRTAEQAERLVEAFLAEVGVDAGPRAVDRLRELPAAALLEAQAKVVEQHMGVGGLPFTPVVDGVVLPEPPIEAIGKGQAAGVSVLVGTTRDEWKLFTMMDTGLATLDDDGAARRVATLIADPSRAKDVITHYRASRPNASVGDLWSDVGTDVVFRIPAVRLAERQSALGNDVFMYRFDYATPVFGGVLGACHALEIPFVFESLDAGAEMFVGPLTDDLRTLARRMHESWVAFARTGQPSADGLPDWPKYTEQHRATMLFDLEPTVVDDPAGDDREVWAGLL